MSGKLTYMEKIRSEFKILITKLPENKHFEKQGQIGRWKITLKYTLVKQGQIEFNWFRRESNGSPL